MKNQLFAFCLLVGLLGIFSCNPDCENYANITAVVTPISETQLLIQSIPASFIEERELYIAKEDNRELRVDETTRINSTYDLTQAGRIIDISELEDSKNTFYYIRDIDCGGYIPLDAVYDCETQNIVVDIAPKFSMPGEQIIITTTPTDFLQNKELFIKKRKNDASPSLLENAAFNTELGGVIATLPSTNEMDEGVIEIFVENKICGGFTALNSAEIATIPTTSFMLQNPALFVVPNPPNIYIPSPPITVPTNVVNTWFSPDDRSYCIWFLPEFELDPSTGCYREKTELKPGDPAIGPGSGSYELKACASTRGNADDFAGNPITSGVIDTLTGEVRFTIDRTAKNLGRETFVGKLSVPDIFPDRDQILGACVPDPTLGKAKLMMVVTSQLTGRQMVLYRYDLNGLGIHGINFCKPE